jgi:membrane protein YqaA with SNARE-associated domain
MIAFHLARFFWLLFLATVMGGMIGGLLGSVSFAVSAESPEMGVSFGVPFGAIIGFLLYIVAHWLVLRIPLERTAKSLIGGTLIGSIPLALIPNYGAVLSVLGGVIGYCLGLIVLLIGENRDAAETTGR